MIRHQEDAQAVTTAMAKAIIEITGLSTQKKIRESLCTIMDISRLPDHSTFLNHANLPAAGSHLRRIWVSEAPVLVHRACHCKSQICLQELQCTSLCDNLAPGRHES